MTMHKNLMVVALAQTMASSFAAPTAPLVVRQPVAEIVWTRDICVEKGRYLGWPTAAKLPSGEVLVAFSGDRSRHICPWGREELIRSTDRGETWTKPETVENGPLDDRDPGLVVLNDGRLMMTWMTSVAFADPVYCKSDDYRRHLEKLPPSLVKASLGNFCKFSSDGGRAACRPRTQPDGAGRRAGSRVPGIVRRRTDVVDHRQLPYAGRHLAGQSLRTAHGRDGAWPRTVLFIADPLESVDMIHLLEKRF